jgi:hypothetical protein
VCVCVCDSATLRYRGGCRLQPLRGQLWGRFLSKKPFSSCLLRVRTALERYTARVHLQVHNKETQLLQQVERHPLLSV